MCRASIFSIDMTMISYFNTIINVIIVTDPTFSRVIKIIIAVFSYHKFKCFVKMFFYNVTAIFTSFDPILHKIVYFIFA